MGLVFPITIRTYTIHIIKYYVVAMFLHLFRTRMTGQISTKPHPPLGALQFPLQMLFCFRG